MEELWSAERDFWLSGQKHYEEATAEGAVMVFPDPVGILTGRAIIEGLQAAPRWSEVAFLEGSALVEDGTAVLAYRAEASREGGEPYRALCTSCYRRSEDRWCLVSHHQTPAE
ncbi:nuclear transport factor 2 family protein [Roseicyclus sp. F158]|uniref:Nuclear transport factor 2 family protein n=1 Tax=Tropicimonas omnivorans TaxID=3075590 RepID=A0ABU3DKM1_9RHOB|nr:nuclear transport factor 2 family protein [Roseicyclus sp. F158]MDT0684255.1 nuclear transport factor 2 family protein [Roseicyclus sp. F158]